MMLGIGPIAWELAQKRFYGSLLSEMRSTAPCRREFLEQNPHILAPVSREYYAILVALTHLQAEHE